jgi:hypothetical protein
MNMRCAEITPKSAKIAFVFLCVTIMVNVGLVGIVVVFTIIGAAFGSYYITALPVSSQIASYQSVISSMSAHPQGATFTTTVTQFVVSVVTETNAGTATTISSTTTVTSVVTSTETAYPLSDNLTVWFRNSGSNFTYAVNSPTFSVSNSTNVTSIPIRIAPIYTNEMFNITASCVMPCAHGMSFSATLFFNGNVAQEESGNENQSISFSYTLS